MVNDLVGIAAGGDPSEHKFRLLDKDVAVGILDLEGQAHTVVLAMAETVFRCHRSVFVEPVGASVLKLVGHISGDGQVHLWVIRLDQIACHGDGDAPCANATFHRHQADLACLWNVILKDQLSNIAIGDGGDGDRDGSFSVQSVDRIVGKGIAFIGLYINVIQIGTAGDKTVVGESTLPVSIFDGVVAVKLAQVGCWQSPGLGLGDTLEHHALDGGVFPAAGQGEAESRIDAVFAGAEDPHRIAAGTDILQYRLDSGGEGIVFAVYHPEGHPKLIGSSGLEGVLRIIDHIAVAVTPGQRSLFNVIAAVSGGQLVCIQGSGITSRHG